MEDGSVVEDPPVLWTHPRPETTAMSVLLREVNAKYHLDLKDYGELLQWSTDNVGPFWETLWTCAGVRASKSFDKVRWPPVNRVACYS